MVGGDPAGAALDALLDRFAGNNAVSKALAGQRLDRLRAELSGPDPTAIEKLLVDRVAAGWLHLHTLEVVFARKESYGFQTGAYFERALTQAQRRYTSALKALADVRRLALPALQISIARNQKNTAVATTA